MPVSALLVGICFCCQQLFEFIGLYIAALLVHKTLCPYSHPPPPLTSFFPHFPQWFQSCERMRYTLWEDEIYIASFRVRHSAVLLFVPWPIVSICIHHNLVGFSASLMRAERQIICLYNDKPLGVGPTLCLFWTIMVFPVGPMTCAATGSCLQ